MRRGLSWYRQPALVSVLLMVMAFLMGCSTPVPAVSPSETEGAAPSQTATNLGQMLPVTAQFKVADQVIQLEVARTVQQQAIGLMFRPSLPDDRGMLFLFNPARPVGFWMKNVVIPLDMVFLRNGQVAAIASNVPPCKADPCPIYGPNATIDQVIELRGGRATELGLKVGDQLTIQYYK